MNAVQKWLSLVLCSALVACGGGGGSEAPTAAQLAVDPARALAASNALLDANDTSFRLSAQQSIGLAPTPSTSQAGAVNATVPPEAGAPAVSAAVAASQPASAAGAALAPAQPTVAQIAALAPAPVAHVVSLVKVGETRIDRTTFDYTFKVVLASPNKSIVQATATVQTVGEGSSVIGGAAIFDAVAAGAQVTSKNTITLRHDRTKPFNAAAVTWVVRTFTEPTRAPIEASVQRAVLDPALLDGNRILIADPKDPMLLNDSSGTFGSVGAVLLYGDTVRRIKEIQPGVNGARILITQEVPATAAFKDLAFTTTVNPLAALMMVNGGATIQTAPESLGRKFTQGIKKLFAAPESPPFLDFVLNNRFACFAPNRVVESESGELEVRWEVNCTTAQLGAALGKTWPNIGGIEGHYLQKTSQTYKLDRAAGDDYTVANSRSELAITLTTNARVAANQLPLMNDPEGRCEKKGVGVECEWPLFKKPVFSNTYVVVIAGVPVPVAVEVRPKLTLELSGEGTIKGMRVSTRETISGVKAGVKLPDPDASSFSDDGSTPLVDASYGAAAALEFGSEVRVLLAAKVDIGKLKHVSDTSLSTVEAGAGGYAQASRVAQAGRVPCFSASAGGVASLEVSFLDSPFLRNIGLFDGIKVLQREKRWPAEASKVSAPNGCADAADAERPTLGYVIVGRENYKADGSRSSLNRDVYVASGNWLLEKKAAGTPIIIDFTKVFTENPAFRKIALDDLTAEVPGVGFVGGNLVVVPAPDGSVLSALYSIPSAQLVPGSKLLVNASTYENEDGKREKTRSTQLIRIDFEVPPQASATYEFERKRNGSAQFSVAIAYADLPTRLALSSARIERGDGTQVDVGRILEPDATGNSVDMLKTLVTITQNGLEVPVRAFDDLEAQRPKWLLLETPTTEGIGAVYRIPISADTTARVSTVAFANQGSGRIYAGDDVLDPLSELKVLVYGHNLPAELPLDMSWCSRLVETVTDEEMFRVGARSTVEREFTCTISRAGQGLQTTVLGFAAQPQSVAELTGLPLRGPQTVTQGEVSDFSLLAARFTDYARNLVTVFWNFGGEVVREVQGLAQHVSHAFATAGDRIISVVYQVLGERIGSEPGYVARVQPGSGISVTAVAPLTAIAGVAQTFDVTGANMPLGLVFTLKDCDNPVEVQVGTNPGLRRFTCTFAPTAAEGLHDGTIASGSSIFGPAPYFEFKVSVSRVVLNLVQPAQTLRSIATSFEFTGQNLPTTGLSVVPVGNDGRSNCLAPNNATANGFGVACELFKVGAQVLEVRHGNQVLGTSTVTVASNVTGVTWTSPSTNRSGTVRFGETVTFAVRGENLTTDPVMGFAVEKCGVSNEEVGLKTATQRTFTCFFNNQAGAVAGQMPGVVKDAPGGQVLFDGWKVPVEVPVAASSSETLEGAFSNNPTPSAPWSFGWQSVNGAAPTPYGKFTAAGTDANFPTLAIWNKGDGNAPASVYPYVYKNTGNSPVFYTAGVTEFPAQSIIVTPGSAGERAVFRWTAPVAGTYEVTAWFELMQGGSVDVRVQKNGTNLFATQIAGKGSVATAPLQTVVLAAGDAVEFAVGDGGNTNHSDITRVSASVSTAATPSAPALSIGDTMIASWHDTAAAPTYGAETYLYTCGAGWGGTGQALLRFDHGQVPSAARTVYLNLYAISGDDINGIGTTMEVVRVNGNWSEATTQWISRPSLAEIHGTFATPNGQYGRWVRVPITSLVKAWQNGTYANQGLAVWGVTNPFAPCRMYASREAPGNEPYLSWE